MSRLSPGRALLSQGKEAEMSTSGMFLQWEGKRLYRQRIPKPRLLEPIAELSVGVASPNMVIEGDNLQVLASLKSRYAGQVDVVYIDPPYNLGTNDFRYSDKRFHDPDADDSDAVYVKNEDGGRHTKWLNFMAPRLYMLWEMLSDQGVLFASINDIELYRLGMLLEEIFGEENHVGTIVWRGSADNNPTRIAVEHEYILCYAKSASATSRVWSSPEDSLRDFLLDQFAQLKERTPDLAKLKKEWRALIKANAAAFPRLGRYTEVDEHNPYQAGYRVHNPGREGYRYDVIHPRTGKPCKQPLMGYRFPKETMDQLIADNRIIFGKDENTIVQMKDYLEDFRDTLRSVIDLDARTGAYTLANLFGGDRTVFKNPKPVELMERLLAFTTRPDSLVLDAFAGSGTTGHAILSLNQRDGGQRRFIMVEEGRIGDKFARNLTAERIKRAIQHYGYSEGFTFYRTGRKLDRQAIVGLERDALAALICQADETGRGRGISRLSGYQYIIGKNYRNEAICLVWNGATDGEVTKEHYRNAATEVTAAGLKRPFRMYGTSTPVGDTASWKFCQIPDEILAQMHIQEDLEPDEVEAVV